MIRKNIYIGTRQRISAFLKSGSIAQFCKAKKLVIPLLRGLFYKLYYQLRYRNVKISLPLIAHSRLRISGPGKVTIGPFCSVFVNTFQGLSITTYTKNAEVRIGQQCNLGGLTINCHNQIIIGDQLLSANALIQDRFLNYSGKCSGENLTQNNSIVIGNRVWLASHACVLGNSVIGDGNVVTIGSVVYDKERFSDDQLIFGNPAYSVMSKDKLALFIVKQ